MLLIVAIVVLGALRYFEIGPFASLSWWWIGLLFVITYLWFEFGEKALGLDKRRAHDEADRIRRERVKKNFR